MGVKLPVPLAPFQELDVQGESITIDVNAKQIVIPTDNQYLLPSFNQWTLNPNRCNLEETPCGGLKNSIVQDSFPGSLSIEGDGCYLQNLAGTYIGKSIGAGKLSETSDIINTGDTGIEIATADGIILRMGDGLPFLLRPPSAIVEKFVITNISNESQTYTLTVFCPDLISSIELYNITNETKESVTFTKITNGYSFSKTISPVHSESFQITVIYTDLGFTQLFTNDANQTIGLQNMSESWIALIPVNGPEISIFRFSDRPRQLEFKQNENGVITEVTLYPGNGSIYHSQVTHSDISRISGTGYIPDSLNIDSVGSVSKFIKPYGMNTKFSQDVNLTTWVVPAISDTKILPLSEISDDFLGDEITLRMCPGEYGCASFVVRSTYDININIAIQNDNNIDIKPRVVKCWLQSGSGMGLVPTGRYLTPELIINDDSLVYVDADTDIDSKGNIGSNYLKLTDGTYIDISTTSKSLTPVDIRDANAIQTINLKSEYNKQIWITLHILSTTLPGAYTYTISLLSDTHLLKTVTLNLVVLNILLHPSMIEYSVYYRAKVTTLTDVIDANKKSIAQYTTDMYNCLQHGVTNPIIDVSLGDFDTILTIREELGFDNSSIFYRGVHILSTPSLISAAKSIADTHGVSELYIYGIDEHDLSPYRNQIIAAHDSGCKVFCSQSYTQATNVADILDLANISYAPDISLSALYHNYTSLDGKEHKIYSYLNPQSAVELPRTFRLNYGLLLWQNNYDGAMDFAYQFEPYDDDTGNVWNDFDNPKWREHNFTYPTIEKPIDTVQWEGYREASNDMQYLATLQAAITEAKTRGVVTADIETWLAALKSTDLSTVDLDDVRGQMIDYILQLQDTENYRAVLMADGDAICFGNGQQLFVRE